MWIIATWIILFLDLLFIREFDATLLFVNEKKKKTFYEALKICKEDYGARIATVQFLRRMNLLKQRNKLSKCVPFNTKIWFTEFRNNARQAGKGAIAQYQEVWWFNGTDPERELVRSNSHHYFLCDKDEEISELSDHSTILCNDDSDRLTKSGNSFNPRTPRLVTKEKKSSLTTKWRYHFSRTDRDLFTERPVSSDSPIGTRESGAPTGSDLTTSTGRDLTDWQLDLSTAIPTQDNAFANSTHSSTVEIAILAVLGLIAVIFLSAILRLIYSRRKECAASQQTYEICDLDRRAVNNQNRDDIYDLPFHVTDRPASRAYENT